MIKKLLIIPYSFFKKKFYRNNIDLMKENTWKSSKTAKKFFITHNKKKNILFDDYFSEYFTKKIQKKDSVLDLGCGTGRLTKMILKKTKKVYAIDNSEEMLKFAPKKAKLIKASAFNLPLKDNQFNFTLSMDLLLHFKNYKKIISEMSRVTKVGGYLIFNIGNKEHIEFGKKLFGKKIHNIYDETGKSLTRPYYSAVSNKELKNLGKKNGLIAQNFIPYNFFQGNIILNSFSNNNIIIAKTI